MYVVLLGSYKGEGGRGKRKTIKKFVCSHDRCLCTFLRIFLCSKSFTFALVAADLGLHLTDYCFKYS